MKPIIKMTRNNIFAFIQMIVCCDQKQAKNHYDYLIQKKTTQIKGT